MSLTKKLLSLALPAALLVLLFVAPASAQVTTTDGTVVTGTTTGTSGLLLGDAGLTALGKAIGLGLVIVGAARGIGMIGSHAVDATARQPEAAGNIFQSSIILAALIEGATLFAIVALAFLF